MMVVYEVNLTVNNEIFEEYYTWLIKHMDDMLQFRGFKKAEISLQRSDLSDTDDKKKMTVRYSIENEKDLDDYLNNHAKKMRTESIEKFGDQFSASRRIFFEPVIVII